MVPTLRYTFSPSLSIHSIFKYSHFVPHPQALSQCAVIILLWQNWWRQLLLSAILI